MSFYFFELLGCGDVSEIEVNLDPVEIIKRLAMSLNDITQCQDSIESLTIGIVEATDVKTAIDKVRMAEWVDEKTGSA